MIYMYSKTLVRVRRCVVSDSARYKLGIFLSRPLSSSLEPISGSTNQPSFTISYLINACGLTPEAAVSASKYVNIKTPEKADLVISLFENHGFTKPQISTLIRKVPTLILADPKKTLLPKFEFFYAEGISKADLAKIATTSPIVLKRSLKKQIIPSFNQLKTVFHSQDKLVVALKRFPEIVSRDHHAITIPNIEILRKQGVKESNIAFLLTCQPRSLMIKSTYFKEVVENVKKMGFNPLKCQFVIAVHAVRSMTKSTWKRKFEVYKTWGWSEEQTMLAFRRNPWCLMISEEKIMSVMNFYVNTMGWDSSLIARRSKLLSLSLRKRILPRCSVLQVLLSKGLIKKHSMAALLESTESLFLQKFVTCYEEAPQLLELYQEKMDLSK